MAAAHESNAPQDPRDSDAQETREWLDSLEGVIQAEGTERAHFLIEQLLESARQHSIDLPFSAKIGRAHI